jgi:hypothetical protein
MPPRKYEDLAHLSPEEYRKESQKRREKERKEYHHKKYMLTRGKSVLDNKQQKIEEEMAALAVRLEELKMVAAGVDKS